MRLALGLVGCLVAFYASSLAPAATVFNRPATVQQAAAPRPAARPAGQSARERYLQYARASADWTWDHQDELLAQWRKTFDPDSPFGYRAPGNLIDMALIYASLCEKENNATYAERARKVLLTYGDYRSQFPEWAAKKRPDYTNGVPALPDFFVVMRFVRAYDILHRLGKLTPAEASQVEALVAHSMDYLLQTSEWGAMNRTMLRAESLAWAVRAMKNHPRAAVYEKQRRALGDDNWGNWEIEDATIYHGVWIYALLGYADALGRMPELFKTPEFYYYTQYFLNLMSPAAVVPDFGDAQWTSNWQHFLVFFEAAAAQLNDPTMKWAARTIAEKYLDFDHPTSSWMGCFLLDAYRWGRDDIQPQAPTTLSAEVMEDVQGKKIVFRNGWKADSTYLLLNYRDEGDGGMNFRDYLRDSIPVEEEKMTHGHADENSIPLLMSGGSVLLHDGGYRDYMPSGPYGAYRQDYFHNRLVVRPEKIFLGQKAGEQRYSTKDAVAPQGLLEFLRDAGSYRPVRTKKVDFLSLPEFDYSRTRLIDDGWGYEADRVIVFVKNPEMFVVFDIFKSRTEEFFTLANLWHTRQVLAKGEHWYDTGYDAIGTQKLPPDRRLLVAFPQTHFRIEGIEPLKRHYQDEQTIYQVTASHFEPTHTAGFVTVLVPHGADQSPSELASRVRFVETAPERTGMAVTIDAGGRTLVIGVKNDLRMDIARDWRRPRYLYEKGKIAYGSVETDGDFVFTEVAQGQLSYTIVNMTKALWAGRTIFENGQSFHGLPFDASDQTGGTDKVRYWRDSIKVGRQ
ncbi:MAG: hypothetical protein ACM3NQ_00575 [Bacteroidales bacterium]